MRAAKTCTSPELSGALVRAGSRVTVYTRSDDARYPPVVTMPSGRQVVHVDAGPPRAIPKDGCCRTWTAFARAPAASVHRAPPDVRSRPFLDVGARGASRMSSRSAFRSCKRSMRSAAKSGACKAPRIRVPPSGSPRSRASRARPIASLRRRAARCSNCAAWAPTRAACGSCRAASTSLSSDARRELLTLPRRRPYRIVTLSRLVARKGVDDAIAALARRARRRTDRRRRSGAWRAAAPTPKRSA